MVSYGSIGRLCSFWFGVADSTYKRDDSHLMLSRGECQINIIIHYQINYWVCGKPMPMPNHSWRNNTSHFGYTILIELSVSGFVSEGG